MAGRLVPLAVCLLVACSGNSGGGPSPSEGLRHAGGEGTGSAVGTGGGGHVDSGGAAGGGGGAGVKDGVRTSSDEPGQLAVHQTDRESERFWARTALV